MHSGASSFLLKDAPPDELLKAIRTVHRGTPSLLLRRRVGCWTMWRPCRRCETCHCCRLSEGPCTGSFRIRRARQIKSGNRRGILPLRGDGEDSRRSGPGRGPSPRPGSGCGPSVCDANCHAMSRVSQGTTETAQGHVPSVRPSTGSYFRRMPASWFANRPGRPPAAPARFPSRSPAAVPRRPEAGQSRQWCGQPRSHRHKG